MYPTLNANLSDANQIFQIINDGSAVELGVCCLFLSNPLPFHNLNFCVEKGKAWEKDEITTVLLDFKYTYQNCISSNVLIPLGLYFVVTEYNNCLREVGNL